MIRLLSPGIRSLRPLLKRRGAGLVKASVNGKELVEILV